MEELESAMSALSALGIPKKRKKEKQKRWDMGPESQSLKKELEPKFKSVFHRPSDYDAEEWMEVMTMSSRFAQKGKREKRFLMAPARNLARHCVHIFQQHSDSTDLLNRTCDVIVKVCHGTGSDKDRDYRKEFAKEAGHLVPALRLALQGDFGALENVLRVIAELSYQCEAFSSECSLLIPDILAVVNEWHRESGVTAQACITLCNLCFSKNTENRKIVVNHPFFKNRQYIDLLGDAVEGKFCERLFKLLATLAEDETFRQGLDAVQISRAVEVLSKFASDEEHVSVTESVCNFLHVVLQRRGTDTPMDDDEEAPVHVLFSSTVCLHVCAAFVRMVHDLERRKLKNSCVKRFLYLLRGLRQTMRETGCVQVATMPDRNDASIRDALCTVLDCFLSSYVLVKAAIVLVNFFVSEDTSPHLAGSVTFADVRRHADAVASLCTEEQFTGLRAPLHLLLTSLGYEPTFETTAQGAAASRSPATAQPMDVDPIPARPQASARAPIDLTAELSSAPVQPDGEPPAGNAKPLTRDMRDAVQQGLAAGMTRVRRVRISLCGQFGTGKTSLMDSIKDEPFVPDKPSTLVLDVEQSNLFHRDGTLKAEPDRTTMHLLGGEFCKVAKQLEMQRLEMERLERQRREELRRNSERALQEEPRRQQRPLATLQPTPAPPPASRPAPAVRPHAQQMASQEPAAKRKTAASAHPPAQPSPVRQAPVTTPVTSTVRPTAAQERRRTSNDSTPTIDMTKLKEELINEILADEDLMREIGDDEVIVSTWDCGGQSIFSSMQHFLMGEEYVIYILCFSAVDDLSAVKAQTYKRLGSTASSDNELIHIDVPEHLQNIDHIRHWLTTIHLASMTSSQEKPEKYPPVLMVGNFADKLNDTITLEDHKSGIWNNLQKLCYRSPTFKGMLEDTTGVSTRDEYSLFLIDNTQSGSSDALSPQVQELCHALRRAISSILDGKQIKKQWLRFEWILKHLNSIKDRPGYTDRQSIARLAKTACDVRNDGDLEEMLLFYDRLRLIIYKPTEGSDRSTDDDIIIYNMSWLIGQINRLIFGPRFMDDGTANQRSGEDPATDDLRHRLWEKGILDEMLVSRAWKRNKPEVSNKILDVMAAWNLLYEYTPDTGSAGRKRTFFVPSALQKKPDKAVLDAMRANGDASDDELLFSTSDCPLLILLQDCEDPIAPEPDTPLPHSCYCQLLVKLMKRWQIKITQKMKCSLDYNSARIKVPKPALKLNEFNGHVELFVAHYDSSGALLVSLGFKHPTSDFKDGFLSLSDGKKVSIASVCCQVRETIYDELLGLRDPKLPPPKMFTAPLRPTCDCELANWKDKRTGSSDLGYVPWKVRFERKALPPVESIYKECDLCGEESKPDGNARCWFDRSFEFNLDGEENKPAREKLKRLRNPAARLQQPPATAIPQELTSFFNTSGLNQSMLPWHPTTPATPLSVTSQVERAQQLCERLNRAAVFPVPILKTALETCQALTTKEEVYNAIIQHFQQPVQCRGWTFTRCVRSRRNADQSCSTPLGRFISCLETVNEWFRVSSKLGCQPRQLREHVEQVFTAQCQLSGAPNIPAVLSTRDVTSSQQPAAQVQLFPQNRSNLGHHPATGRTGDW